MVVQNNNNASDPLHCKRCKARLVNGLKCSDCQNYFHLSCAKLMNSVQFVDEETIKCCDNSGETSTASASDTELTAMTVDVAFHEAISELADSENKVDIRIFRYVIKQKDDIISELRGHVKLLQNQIESLGRKSTMESSSTNIKDLGQRPSVNKQQSTAKILNHLTTVSISEVPASTSISNDPTAEESQTGN